MRRSAVRPPGEAFKARAKWKLFRGRMEGCSTEREAEAEVADRQTARGGKLR